LAEAGGDRDAGMHLGGRVCDDFHQRLLLPVPLRQARITRVGRSLVPDGPTSSSDGSMSWRWTTSSTTARRRSTPAGYNSVRDLIAVAKVYLCDGRIKVVELDDKRIGRTTNPSFYFPDDLSPSQIHAVIESLDLFPPIRVWRWEVGGPAGGALR
jgi:hypothetical protein